MDEFERGAEAVTKLPSHWGNDTPAEEEKEKLTQEHESNNASEAPKSYGLQKRDFSYAQYKWIHTCNLPRQTQSKHKGN